MSDTQLSPGALARLEEIRVAATSAIDKAAALGPDVDITRFRTVSEQQKIDTLESLGKVQTNFGDGLTYVDSSAVGSAAVVLKPTAPATSKSGFFVVRSNVPNSTLAAASQKVTTYPVTLGPQRRGPVNGTGKFTWKQQVVLTGPPVEGTTAA